MLCAASPDAELSAEVSLRSMRCAARGVRWLNSHLKRNDVKTSADHAVFTVSECVTNRWGDREPDMGCERRSWPQ